MSSLIYQTNFHNPSQDFKTFDSFNYHFSNDGLILKSTINSDTGACQPARFRAFGIPLVKNEYATSTIQVPSNVNGHGLDFSFWYFNTKHKYGFASNLKNTDFDNNEFDVDEIHNDKHYISLYVWNQHNTFKQIPCSKGFCNIIHTFGIKWTDLSITYYIDNNPIFNKSVVVDEQSVFPTWEIETPLDGLSSGWGGAINPKDFPSLAIVKNYKVYKL